MITNLDKRLKSLLIDNNLSIEELSDKLNIDINLIYGILNNTRLPDIELLPSLADTLNTSIDYLLTGKEYKNIESNLEVIAKNDSFKDIYRLEHIEALDNKNNSIFKYILDYNSINTFKAIVDKYSLKVLINNKNIDKQEIYSILIKFNMIEDLDDLKFFKSSLDDPLQIFNKSFVSIYSEGYLDLFIRYVDYPSNLFNRLFSLHTNDLINPIGLWQDLYSRAIYFALLYNKKGMAVYLINLIIAINSKALDLYNSNDGSNIYNTTHSLASHPSKGYSRDSFSYSVVALSRDSLIALLDNGFLDEANKLYEINKLLNINLIRDGYFKASEMKRSGSVDNNSIYVERCLDNGIIDIKDLLKSNNYYLIKNALFKYPILNSELGIKDKEEINKEYIKLGQSPKLIKEAILKGLYPLLINNKNEVISIEYLKSLYNDNEYDLLVIKLSVKLEGILKNKYRLSGTLEEMINEYTTNYDLSDDDISLLNKLRRERNGAVHSERLKNKLAKDELNKLIILIERLM